MNYNLETYFLLFMIYSILGWCMESVKMIFNKNVGHFVDRGFLIGPYLPIYGSGVVAITFLLGKYSNDIPALFWLSMITCGILEYFTSYFMEKFFNARWWDYSARKFNINGRICLETLIPFGIAGVVTVCFTNPIFVSWLEKLPTLALHIISITSLVIILIDSIVSFVIIAGLKNTEADLSSADDTENISKYVQEITEDIAMQFESDVRKNHRKRRIKRQRKLIHLKVRANKQIREAQIKSQKLHARLASELEELNEKIENAKSSHKELTAQIKENFAKKSFLHKRLMDAFPTFEISEKLKDKIKNKKN